MLNFLYINEYVPIMLFMGWVCIANIAVPKTKANPKIYLISFIGLIVFFYCPVPKSVEDKMANQIINAIKSNNKIVLTNTQLATSKMDSETRLKTRELFTIKHAFQKDLGLTFKKQNGIFSMESHKPEFIPDLKKITQVVKQPSSK